MTCALIYGSRGQLGSELVCRLDREHINVVGLDLPEYDISSRQQVKAVIRERKPDIVINAAAFTDVDQAENDKKNAFKINKNGPAFLAEACSIEHIPLIHVSTDYVFDGRSSRPYGEVDSVNPINNYGKSKEAGEREVRHYLSFPHIIIRTSWLFGSHGKNFVRTMIRLGCERDTLNVVDDQYGCPTYAGDLADAIIGIMNVIEQKTTVEWGTYHYCGESETTWYHFSKKIFQLAEGIIPLKVRTVIPIKTKDYPTLAKRPSYSVLNCEKIKRNFDIKPKPWEASLKHVIEEIAHQDYFAS